MNQVNQISSYLRTQQNNPNEYFWNSIIDLLNGDVNLMQGPQEAVSAQFQNYLKALYPFVSLAEGSTLDAYHDLVNAFHDYEQNPEIGNTKIEAALSEFQSHPLNMSNDLFRTATRTLIDEFHGLVAAGDVRNASDSMRVLFYLIYSPQIPPSYTQNFISSSTPLMAAYNLFAQTLVTGGPPPTKKEIDDLLIQIDHLKGSV